MNTQIQTLSFDTLPVQFSSDAFLNATAIAKHFGKRPNDYLKTEQTQEYIAALAEHLSVTKKIVTDKNQLVIVKQGNSSKFEQGTWLHPKLAIHFARWLNPKFAVWCDEQIENLLSGKLKAADKTKTAERTGLRNAVNLLVSKKGLNYSEAYSMVHQRFNVESIEDLSRSQLNEAVEYVHRVVLEGEVLDKEPTPPAYPCNLMSLLKHAEYVFQWLMHHEPAIRLFNDTLACNLIGRVFDGYCCAADTAKKIGFKFQSYEYWRAYPFDGDNDTIRRYYELNAA